MNKFNLNNAIKKWVAPIKKHSGYEDGQIEELVNHLHDEIEYLLSKKFNEETAFNTAVKNLGDVNKIGDEYKVLKSSDFFSTNSNFISYNYLTHLIRSFFPSLRILFKYKSLTLINILCLSIGILSFSLTSVWFLNEQNYDTFHEDFEKIFRLNLEHISNSDLNSILTPIPLADALISTSSQIKIATRFQVGGRMLLKYKNRAFYEERGAMVDKSFFKVFNFKLFKGDYANLLKSPLSIIITKSLSTKYFGNQDPIGQTLIVENALPFIVTGVIEDIPYNSHLQFNFLVPIEIAGEKALQDWKKNTCLTYIKTMTEKVKNNLDKELESTRKNLPSLSNYKLKAEPLNSIYLSKKRENDPSLHGSILHIFLTLSIGLAVLIISILNFINLTSIQYSDRVKEISVRKILGSDKKGILLLFTGEAIFISIVSIIVSLALLSLMLENFNNFKLFEDLLSHNSKFKLILFIITSGLIVGMLAGILSSIHLVYLKLPVGLNQKSFFKSSGNNIRDLISSLQFSISIFLIIFTIFVYMQVDFLKKNDVGFEKTQLIEIPLRGQLSKEFNAFKTKAQLLSKIRYVTPVSFVPDDNSLKVTFPVYINSDTNQLVCHTKIMKTDENFLNTFSIKLLRGKFFDLKDAHLKEKTYVITKNLFDKLKNKSNNVIGKIININEKQGRIIGVVNNFNFGSPHFRPLPVVIETGEKHFHYCVLKFEKISFEKMLLTVRGLWEEFLPEYPFEYRNFSDSLNNLSLKDESLKNNLLALTILSIIVTSLGLFGLTLFKIKKLSKEIGIRKINGASSLDILKLINKKFLVVIFIANGLAWPITFYITRLWLNYFENRISINYLIFPAVGILVMVIVIITISVSALKITSRKLADCIKYE